VTRIPRSRLQLSLLEIGTELAGQPLVPCFLFAHSAYTLGLDNVFKFSAANVVRGALLGLSIAERDVTAPFH